MKFFRLFLFSILLLPLPVSVRAATAPEKREELTADQVPKGLAKSDWQSIRAAYEAGRHDFPPIEGGWQAGNPGQRWTTDFEEPGPQGLRAKATSTGLWINSLIEGSVSGPFQVRATGFGRSQSMGESLLSVGNVEVNKNCARFIRPGLTEEYSRTVEGVRQDFIVADRPTGDGHLRVELALSGAVAKNGEGGLMLWPTNAKRGVAYHRLHVTDQRGMVLPAKLIAESETQLAVLVDDFNAEYPLRIDPTFSDSNWTSFGGLPGTNGQVTAMLQAGGVLYVAGEFTVLGNITANGIAKWDGTTWTALGSGITSNGYTPSIYALAADSLGKLYAAGRFESAGGVSVSNIAKWDGTTWSALGTGTNDLIWALATDASNNVYAGGDFLTAGGMTVNRIAKWSGSAWTPLGTGMNNRVSCLAVDRSGRLHAGGLFTTAGGVSANRLAKWSGSSWSAFGSGSNGQVNSMTFDGSDNLYVSGLFSSVNGVPANSLAKWNGTAWSTLGTGLSGANSVGPLLVEASGNLYVGGSFHNAGGITVNHIAKWNGLAWSALGSGIDDPWPSLSPSYSGAMAFGPDGALYVGGRFGGGTVGGVAVMKLAKWKDNIWSVPTFQAGFWGRVNAVTTDAGGQSYAAGQFEKIGNTVANYIAKWSGSSWSPLGSGLAFPSGLSTRANAVVTDANGNLFVGGFFSRAGDVDANYIAKWNGTAWSALGAGMNDEVYSLCRDGVGNLYAGGSFTTAGGITVNGVAKWNGTAWTALGSGMNNSPDGAVVFALTCDRSGNLYAGGTFKSAGSVSANRIAKWNGSTWSPLGAGIEANYVYALTFDSAGNLYAGGDFGRAGGVDVNRIAKWNGTVWSSLGTGLSKIGGGLVAHVKALAVATDGSLYAAGEFDLAGGVISNRIAKWNGTSWSALGSGTNAVVNALAVSGMSLDVGGEFTVAGGKVSAYMAKASLAIPPTVISLSPNIGSTVGGTSVTISGTDFSGANAVTFGGIAAPSFTIVDSTLIIAITAAHAPGVTDVSVSTPSGFGIGGALYTYAVPLAVFDNWATSAGLSGANASPASTPFNDGVQNLLKYAFNMNATGPDTRILAVGGTSGLPSVKLDTSGAQPMLRVSFLRRKGSGLVYTPQRSNDLQVFSAMTATEIVTPINAQWERVTVEEPALSTIPSAFGRVKVSLP